MTNSLTDEIDELEEGCLEQRFEWVKEDQAPDQKSLVTKAAISTASTDLQKEPVFIPTGMGWGGALTYCTPSSSVHNGGDTPTARDRAGHESLSSKGDDVGSVWLRSTEAHYSMLPSDETGVRFVKPAAPYQKKASYESPELVMKMDQTIRDLEFLSTTEISFSASMRINHRSLEEPEPLSWAIDTTPDVMLPMEIDSTCIESPVESGNPGRKKRKKKSPQEKLLWKQARAMARQEKAKKRPEKTKAKKGKAMAKRVKRMAKFGIILLEETDDEEDDSELALKDYMEV